jgi:hypothetical protein
MKKTERQVANRPPRDQEDREAFVTYSRREGALHEIDDLEPVGPLYDAVEVPHVERPPPRDAFDPRLDIRADRALDDGPDPFEPEPSPRRLRYLVLVGIGVIAIAAGVGLLLASFNSSGRVETAAPGTVPAAGDPAAPAGLARTNPDIREIPLTEDGGPANADALPGEPFAAVEPAAPIDPPVPRTRPDPPPATVSIEPDQPAGAAPTAAPAVTAAPQPTATPAPQGEDDFISRIEQTLSRIDEAPAAAPAPTVIAPAAPTVSGAPGAVAGPQDEVLLGDEVLPVGDDIILDGESLAVDPGIGFEPRPGDLPRPPSATAANPPPLQPLDGLIIDDIGPAESAPPQFVPPADIPGANTAPLN